MRRMCGRLLLLGSALSALLGCTNSQLKPPTPEHSYVLPPANDPRFSTPHQFPEKVLNTAPKKETLNDLGGPGSPGGPRGPGRFGVGPGG